MPTLRAPDGVPRKAGSETVEPLVPAISEIQLFDQPYRHHRQNDFNPCGAGLM